MKTNSYTGRARRTDSNHTEIRDALRAEGYSVEDLSGAGDGCPDLLVGADIDGAPWNFLFEVKAPGGKLTPAQVRWIGEWRGQVGVIYSVDDALKILRTKRTK